jgi:sodium-dependent dicarboxylate transporter 2/3/5
MNFSTIIRPLIGPFLFFLTLFLPLDIAAEAHRFLAIFVMTVYLWLEGKVPLFITGLLGVTLSIVMGVEKATTALSAFGHPIIFLFLAGFLYARAMEKVELDRRISLSILAKEKFSQSFNGLILVLFFLTAFLSMWVSNTATTAMMLPIILGILSSLGIQDTKTKTLLLIGVAYSASIGGLGSPVGSPPNIIAIGLLKELKGIHIAFYEWTLYGVPFVILFIFMLFKYITMQIKIEKEVDITFIKQNLKNLVAQVLKRKFYYYFLVY